MKSLIPLFTQDGAGFGRSLPRREVEDFLDAQFRRLAGHPDRPAVVSDDPGVCGLAQRAGLAGVLAVEPSVRPDGPFLPPGSRSALAGLAAQGGLADHEPVMLVDACGPGVSFAVRQEAWRLFTRNGSRSLVGLAPVEDHPVQVRAYHFLAPVGLAYFEVAAGRPGQGAEAAATVLPSWAGPSGGQGGSICLGLSRAGEMTLSLARPVRAEQEVLALFVLSDADHWYPAQSLATRDTIATWAAVLPEGAGLKAVLALHLAMDRSQRRHVSCAVPALFAGAPWVLGQPNHLYAPTPCINSATGRKVLGRQDFPELLAPSGDLAIVAPGRIEDLEGDIQAGNCAGFVCAGEIPPLARLLRLLRTGRAGDAPGTDDAGFVLPKPLFPDCDVQDLRGLRAVLAPALADVEFATGETAAFVKGVLDFFYETVLREVAPQLLHTGV